MNVNVLHCLFFNCLSLSIYLSVCLSVLYVCLYCRCKNQWRERRLSALGNLWELIIEWSFQVLIRTYLRLHHYHYGYCFFYEFIALILLAGG